jgi:NitT/TauT family transport system permease protein
MKTGNFNIFSRVVPPVVVLLAIVIILEAYVRLAQVPRYLMAPPSAIARALFTEAGQLLPALGWTALDAVAGFFASALVGVLLAVLLSTSRLIRAAIYPYTIFFQTVPIIAIAPMLVIWLGFGPWPVGVCAFVVSVFPVIVNTLAGLLSTDPMLADLFRLYGASPAATMWKLRLPSALPSIFSGLRVAAGLSVIGTVVAEFSVGFSVGQVGLGTIIVANSTTSHLDVAFAAILVVSLLGLAMFGAVNLAAHVFLRRWHSSEG